MGFGLSETCLTYLLVKAYFIFVVRNFGALFNDKWLGLVLFITRLR
jgi:hypothetical protein